MDIADQVRVWLARILPLVGPRVAAHFLGRKKSWPVKVLVQGYTYRWDRHTAQALDLDVTYILEPRVRVVIPQHVKLIYQAEWLDGAVATAAETMLYSGDFPVGQRIEAASPPYTSRFVILVPNGRDDAQITGRLVVVAGNRECEATVSTDILTKQ